LASLFLIGVNSRQQYERSAGMKYENIVLLTGISIFASLPAQAQRWRGAEIRPGKEAASHA